MERFDLDIPAYFSFGDLENDPTESMLEYRVKNICAGGAYFFTDNPLKIGTKVDIDFRLDLKKLKNEPSTQSEVKVSGYILRTDSQGMAVKFDRSFKISPVMGHA